MSPQDNPGRPEGDKPEGLSKYLKRMKTVLRPRSGSKRQSVATPDVPTSASQPTYDLYSLWREPKNHIKERGKKPIIAACQNN